MASMTWRRFVTLVAGLSGDSRLAAALSTKKANRRETPAQMMASLKAQAGG